MNLREGVEGSDDTQKKKTYKGSPSNENPIDYLKTMDANPISWLLGI